MTILCVATYFKGEPFLRECRSRGAAVILLTVDSLADAAWPRDAIDEIHTVSRDAGDAGMRHAVDAIARGHLIDRIAALDDFDVETAAMLREHLQVAGIGRTTASRFRDKLAMRMRARSSGVAVPDFSPTFNDRQIDEWISRVRPPWVLKPRSSAAAIGIKKIKDRDELWRALESAGAERSEMLLEAFVPGDVFHVDSIIWNDAVIFAVAFQYGRPPMEIAHEGGLFITRRLPDTSPDARALLEMNMRLQGALGLRRGVSHTEFIRRSGGSGGSGGFVFLETSARVGGAFIVDTIEAGTGINLWREWARIEIAGEGGGYAVPDARHDLSAIVLTLARQESPDMSPYTDPEIAKTIRKDHHAGLIVKSPDPRRIDELIADYSTRFYRDFFATAPPPDRPAE